MSRKRRIFWSLLLSLALAVGLGTGFIPASVVQAEGSGSGFIDLNRKQITEAMGAGWNLGNQLEASSNGTPSESAWTGVKISEKLIRAVKNQGFRSIRIPVSYLSKIGTAPNYKIDTEWLDRIQEVVDWAIKYNLYVVMNIHGDGYSTVTGGWLLPMKSGQDDIKKKYEAVWRQIAERFRDYDHHMIFESMNEVGADAKSAADVKKAYENINAYNQIFVDTVRKTGGNNEKRWLLIPGCNTNIDYTLDGYGFQIPEDNNRSAEIPENEKRIMISVHYYTPWEFCGQEDYKQTQWGSDADPDKSVGYGSENEMETAFAKIKARFVDEGFPVVIGEYGAIDKSKKEDSGVAAAGDADPKNAEYRSYFVWKLCAAAKQNGCVPMYWDNGWNGDFGYALFSRGASKDKELGFRGVGEVTQSDIIKAIMTVYNTDEKGEATAIDIDKDSLSMDLNTASGQLNATLTPAEAGDSIVWQSTDDSVATVDWKGKVSVRGLGTCLIVARTPGGAFDYCTVEVTPPKTFMAGFYGQGSSWQTLSGKNYLEIAENGSKTETFTVQASAEQFKPIRTLFIKDVAVQNGTIDESNLKSATFVIKSFKFNDTEMELDQTEYPYDKATSKDGKLDICLINAWAPEAHHVKGMTTATQGYDFPEDSYVEGTNTVTIVLEIKDAVLDIDPGEEVINVDSVEFSENLLRIQAGQSVSAPAVVAPAEATEKLHWFSENEKVATVSQDGTVTAVKAGETKIHIVTLSGIDQVLPISVTIDPAATEEPTLPPEPSLPPEPTDEPEESLSPGTDATTAPNSTEAPEANASATPNGTEEPGTDASTEPNSTPAPGTDASAAPNKTAAPGTDVSTAPNGTAAPGTDAGKEPNGTAAPGTDASAAPSGTPAPGGKDKADKNNSQKKISVKKATLKKVKSTKKKTVTAEWKKVSGATGYQVVVSLDKKFKKGKKTVTVKNPKTVKVTVKKLKSKKKYFVKVRAYKTVKGKKYYGSYSKVKAAKVR